MAIKIATRTSLTEGSTIFEFDGVLRKFDSKVRGKEGKFDSEVEVVGFPDSTCSITDFSFESCVSARYVADRGYCTYVNEQGAKAMAQRTIISFQPVA